MFAFLIGWSVFWLLLWLFVFAIGVYVKNESMVGDGFCFSGISAVFLLAVILGKLVSGI
jgi:hypothetical protein